MKGSMLPYLFSFILMTDESGGEDEKKRTTTPREEESAKEARNKQHRKKSPRKRSVYPLDAEIKSLLLEKATPLDPQITLRLISCEFHSI
ncbi:hypothetical protein TNIN_255531 [Trichonephila inaurata madagascariensis]|uniref:Uncharacterized protein n=1 Tax=Trichonephila inaurata madagascariensis TaxID=2747483 RepID=A0A8X6WUQ3_9ARAC|nr:hypothetical protein TNIN_176751 [Trichonephila inaurata madagascariensis]GFY47516.1 hypothetical protein TNIN_255531 [Trichonephila inaurata madagascariensis]